MGVRLGRENDGSRVELDGIVDIGCAQELKTALVEVLAEGKGVCVTAEAGCEMDVTALQLIWAAEREANDNNAAFTMAAKLSEAIQELYSKAGLARPTAQTQQALELQETGDARRL